MDKTKKALHKVLREYQKNISNPCNEFFNETVQTEDVTVGSDIGNIPVRKPTV